MSDVEERKIGSLTVRVDRTLCVGFGDCIEEAPDAFELDDDGVAIFLPGAADLSRERILEACRSCPVDALVALDENGEQIVP